MNLPLPPELSEGSDKENKHVTANQAEQTKQELKISKCQGVSQLDWNSE